MKSECNCDWKGQHEVKVEYDSIEKCPKCNKAISPERLHAIVIEKDKGYWFYVSDFCSACKSVIITEYRLEADGRDRFDRIHRFNNSEFINSAPIIFQEEKFDEMIKKISSQFVKIYNQSLQAEKMGLDEIAGLGYRKSVEFLIKDFAIYENPDKVEEIKNTWMKVCIEKYIKNEQIKVLAERSDWIGNDEAHYIRKQENRDITDMKKFIKAMVYFIGMTLITEDAESMENKNNRG